MDWWTRVFGDTTRGRLVGLLRGGSRSVEDLSVALGVTDNAVRAQLVTLERDGLVAVSGTRRGTGAGKPATLYSIAPGAGQLFSTAHIPLLRALLDELAARLPTAAFRRALRQTGTRLASHFPKAEGSREAKAQAAAGILTSLGACVIVERAGPRYRIAGAACPLADVVAAHPDACLAVERLLGDVVGEPVHEQCDRSGPPRCRFTLGAPED